MRNANIGNFLRINHKKGFSLVELLVAMVVLSIVMSGSIAGFNYILNANRANLLRETALEIARNELNMLRSLEKNSPLYNQPDWSQPKDVNYQIRMQNESFRIRYRVTNIASDIVTLRMAQVAVGWDDIGVDVPLEPTGKRYQIVLSTIIVHQ